MLALHINLESATPPYEQICSSIRGWIQTGSLKPGDPVPSIRQLAADLGIARGTVARAYKELEAAGILHTRIGKGTIIAQTASATTNSDDARNLAHDYICAATKAGWSSQEMVDLIKVLSR